MFKSLRRKFIATAVGSVAVVIAILAIALNFINFYKLEERIDTTLLDASKSQALIKIFAEEGDEFFVITKSSPSSEKIFINACDFEASNNVVSILSSNL